MALHDLFSTAINYPITLQDVGNVVGFAGSGRRAALGPVVCCSFRLKDLLAAIGAEVNENSIGKN
jgi:hypothetical protein